MIDHGSAIHFVERRRDLGATPEQCPLSIEESSAEHHVFGGCSAEII